MNRKILIVDDDVDLVDSLAQALIHNGFTAVRAHSAREGLGKLLEERPDLVILDVMMETDTAGFEMANQVRNRRTHSRYAEMRDVPIILLTAINQATNSRFSLNEQESFLPEINDFVTKPFRVDELIEKVRAALP